jgi:hypothetical protein
MSDLHFFSGRTMAAALGSATIRLKRMTRADTSFRALPTQRRRETMAKGQKKSNKEARKPKAEKAKKNASNPSTKGMVADLKR